MDHRAPPPYYPYAAAGGGGGVSGGPPRPPSVPATTASARPGGPPIPPSASGGPSYGRPAGVASPSHAGAGGPPRGAAPTPPPPPPPERRRRSCPWPTFTEAQLRDDTPSRRDGVPHVREKRFWRNVQALMREAAGPLGLSGPTLLTGLIFAARYFALRSYARNDRFVLGTAALFLATKVGDEPRALEAVLKACLGARDAAGLGPGGGKKKGGGGAPAPAVPPPTSDPAYLASLRDAVLTAERALLYALGFELELELPYNAFFAAIHKIRTACPDPEEVALWEEAGPQSPTQLGLNFISDSFRTHLCLMADWRFIGVAAVAMVHQFRGRPVPQVDGFPFWLAQCPDLTEDGLADVMRVISSIYAPAGGGGGGGGGKAEGGEAAGAAGPPTSAAATATALPAPAKEAPPPPSNPAHSHVLHAGMDHPSPASGDAATTPLVEGGGGHAGPPPAVGPSVLPFRPPARPATAPPATGSKRSADEAGLPSDRAAALASLRSLESGELPAVAAAADKQPQPSDKK